MSYSVWVPMGALIALVAASFALGAITSPVVTVLGLAVAVALLIRWQTIRYP